MKENNFRRDAEYWNAKLSVYLHDPPDKALRIPGHEDRSAKLADILGGLSTPDKDVYQKADIIASGMDRVILPGHHRDIGKSGSVDFLKAPILTHPTGSDSPLRIKIRDKLSIDEIAEGMEQIINSDLGMKAGQGGLSEKFKNDQAGFSVARFHYVHHVLRARLADENLGGLGGLWYRLPADTRIPDHSIWQHCAMVSALTSCFRLSPVGQASLLVFNIAPVQDFISRARKLRDFWTASLILSWLSFEGIRQIIEHFGSDHIVYPSVIDQPMVNWFLKEELSLDWLASKDLLNESNQIASLPNKFVCLVPTGDESRISDLIRKSILDAWNRLGENLMELIEGLITIDDYTRSLVDRQFEGFWHTSWASCPMLPDDDKTIASVKRILFKDVWERPVDMVNETREMHPDWDHSGAYYSISHAVTQSFLAAGKSRKKPGCDDEPGIKCQLHGDLEILRRDWKHDSDKNPRSSQDIFWNELKEKWKAKSDFGQSERLSSVALVKRLGYRIFKNKSHPLANCFAGETRFPSTTEIALTDWLDRVEPLIKNDEVFLAGGQEIGKVREILAQLVHEKDEPKRDKVSFLDHQDDLEKVKNLYPKLTKRIPERDDDKYYAILLMNGDHMGRLINGETLGSNWGTVIHPDLKSKLSARSFDPGVNEFWKIHLNDSRLIAPSVHASISDALADFSLHTVPSIISKAKGRLIYAGGDDVCAVLPLSSVLSATRLIAERYRDGFHFIGESTPDWGERLDQAWEPKSGKLTMHLGNAPGISISAGILICHHKKPLYNAMRRVHDLLNDAKTIGGRNAMAIEYEKRSGGPRKWITKWDAKPAEKLCLNSPHQGTLLDCFVRVGRALNVDEKARSMSSSLVYRLKEFHGGIESIINNHPQTLTKFIGSQIARSFDRRIQGAAKSEDAGGGIANDVTALMVNPHPVADQTLVDATPLIIARALGRRMQFDPLFKGGQS